jgi:hypothetical protein
VKKLLVLTAAIQLCVSLTVTGTANADPDTTDDDDAVFIATLDVFNVPYDSKSDAITQAKALCLWYAANDTFFAMGAMQILKENPNYTTADAGHFAGAATTEYCPKYSPKDDG